MAIVNKNETISNDYKPVISVIIPTYNRRYIIDRAIKSVLNQTFKNIEVIVVDDNSSDDTKNLILSYNDTRIKYLKHNTNRGSQAARNTGIKNAKGEYIAFLDSDDEYLPNKLELQYNAFCNSSKKVGVIYSHAQIKDGANINTGELCINCKGNIYKNILKYLTIDFITPLTRKECFEKIGLLDENVPCFQEWDTFIRISRYYEFDYIPEKLAINYDHQGERISQNKLRHAKGIEYVVNKHRKAILRECGSRELADKYCWIADSYYDARMYRLCIFYLIKAMRYDVKKVEKFKKFKQLIKNTCPPKIIDFIKTCKMILINKINNKHYIEKYKT